MQRPSEILAAISSDLVHVETGDCELKQVVTMVKLPTGAIEIAVNNERLPEKLKYILGAYDEDMKLRTNPNIEMVGYMSYILHTHDEPNPGC